MNKIKKLWFTYIIITSVILGGCISDNDDGSGGVAEKTMRFTFTMPESLVNTRAVDAEDGENTVNDLVLLFFEPSTNGTGKYVGYYNAPDDQLPKNNEMEFSLNITFDNGLSKASAYSILAMANMEDNLLNDMDISFDSFIQNIKGMNQNEVVQMAIMNVSGVDTDESDNSKAVVQSNLPMSAQANKAENEANVSMKLIRTVARFDIINNASGYSIQSVSIWNAAMQGSVWEGNKTLTNIPHTKRYYGLKSDGNELNKILGGLYAFENVSVSPEQNDRTTTCLILGIKPNGTTQVTYYRLNVSARERGQYLKRNNVYQITISGVTTAGESTEEDAYANGKFSLDVSINAWDRDEDGLILRNGENLLALPTRKAVFKPQAEERQYYVYTLGTGTLELSYLDMPAGMSARLDGNNLYISVTDYALDQRKGSIELKFAGMSGIIEIVQSGQTEKFLTLSHTTVPSYPAGVLNSDMLAPSPILITSSGSWTAQIYNGEFFSFTTNTFAGTLTGATNEAINNVYTIAVNSEAKSRTAFILVSLDDDPENYRNVIVLTQNGSGDFTMSPSNATVNFEPDMSLNLRSSNEFEVTPSSAGDTWTATFEPGGNGDKFSIEYEDGAFVGGKVTGKGKFKIVPKEVNYTGVYNASVLVSLNNGAKTKRVTVTQSYYDITVTPATSIVASSGGDTKIHVASSSSSSSSLTWSATVTGSSEAVAAGLIPYFSLDAAGKPVTTISGLTVNRDFTVTMPGIYTHLTQQPKATIEVKLDGSTIVKEVTVTQNPVQYVDLYAQSINGYHGSWDAYRNYFNMWIDKMQDTGLFGPSGTLYTQSGIKATSYNNDRVLNNARLFNIPQASSISTSFNWKNVIKDDHVALLYTAYSYSYTNVLRDYSPFSPLAPFTVVNLNTGTGIDRFIVTTGSNTKTKIYKYLMGESVDGLPASPFGTVDPAKVSYRTLDAINCALTSWPDTFIPLMYAPGNPAQVVIGIDPTHRMIFMGDFEFFCTNGDAAANFGAGKEDNYKFMMNLISYMVNVANYGDAFNKKLID